MLVAIEPTRKPLVLVANEPTKSEIRKKKVKENQLLVAN